MNLFPNFTHCWLMKFAAVPFSMQLLEGFPLWCHVHSTISLWEQCEVSWAHVFALTGFSGRILSEFSPKHLGYRIWDKTTSQPVLLPQDNLNAKYWWRGYLKESLRRTSLKNIVRIYFKWNKTQWNLLTNKHIIHHRYTGFTLEA